MSLCQTCQSIPFGSLPPFPNDEYRPSLSGLEHVHRFYRTGVASQNSNMARVRHHVNLEGLRKSAEDGCELCVLIHSQAEALLAELETPKGKRLECSPPDFDTWVSQRPDGGEGFWVWSAPTSNTSGGEILPVAAFAFIVTEGVLALFYHAQHSLC